MAFPDFSEISFAHSILSAIEQRIGGWQVLPNFITPAAEATRGYDVEILTENVPVFIQFKRSEVMATRNCHEFFRDRHRWPNVPIYRMHLHKSGRFRQHRILQRSENFGNRVIYLTSSVPNKRSLNEHYRNGTLLSAGRIFLPSEITLPDTDQEHWVSFNRGGVDFAVYSENGVFSQFRIPSFDSAIGLLIDDAASPPIETLEALKRFVDQFDPTRPIEPSSARGTLSAFPFSDISALPSVLRRAAVLAYFELDSYLFLVPKKRLK
ncbi:hypothetical protein ACCS37_15855 [Rhizobium ruizarguesonis]